MARDLDAAARLDAPRSSRDKSAASDELRFSRAVHTLRAYRRHDHGYVPDPQHRRGDTGWKGRCAGNADHGAGAGRKSIRRERADAGEKIVSQLRRDHEAAETRALHSDGGRQDQQSAGLHVDSASHVRGRGAIQGWSAPRRAHLQRSGTGVESRRSLHGGLEAPGGSIRSQSDFGRLAAGDFPGG